MRVERLQPEGLLLITPQVFTDDRGLFFEVLRKQYLVEAGIENELVQVNQSVSKKDVIRGLHYQMEPKAQGKLVRVIQGRIIDVAVDLRPDSATYLKWSAVYLDADWPQLFWLPRGFAHGFGVLSETAVVEYMCDAYYSPEHDAGIIYNDADLSIEWGITEPIVSDKDKNLKTLRQLNLL